jgi:hypothetical protein
MMTQKEDELDEIYLLLYFFHSQLHSYSEMLRARRFSIVKQLHLKKMMSSIKEQTDSINKKKNMKLSEFDAKNGLSKDE